jgi:hypothetical protein
MSSHDKNWGKIHHFLHRDHVYFDADYFESEKHRISACRDIEEAYHSVKEAEGLELENFATRTCNRKILIEDSYKAGNWLRLRYEGGHYYMERKPS